VAVETFELMRTTTQLLAAAIVLTVAGAGWYAWSSMSSAKVAASGPSRPGASGGPRGAGVRALEVVVAEARRDTITDIVEAVGNARANEAVMVTAKQSGIVVNVHFTEGQAVKRGDVLVEFEAREKKADLETARAQYDEVRSTLERAQKLRESGAVTQARLEDLQAQTRAALARVQSAEARRIDLTVTAPFTGRVGMRQVSPGALVAPGTAITTLDDLSVVKIDFAVPQNVLGDLKLGLPVTASTNALKGRVFQGKITALDTRIDPVTRSVKVVAQFDNKDEALRPGLFLNVALTIGTRSDAVVVPEQAIVALGTAQYLFKVIDGRAQRVEVTLGSRMPGVVEVTSGVAVGDKVVTEGLQKIRDGQQVRIRGAAAPQPVDVAKPRSSQT
jgi:membrane fusion protein (multidrug efflux system)